MMKDTINKNTELKREFARRLERLRKEKRTTREVSSREVALRINVAPAAYRRWEEGTSLPSLANVRSLARYFSVPSDYLLLLTDSQDDIATPRTKSLIIWRSKAILLKEPDREAVRLFELIVSGEYEDWDSLIGYLDDRRYLQIEQVMRVVEEAVVRDLIGVDPLARDTDLEGQLKKRFGHLKHGAIRVVTIPAQLKAFTSFQQLLVALSAVSFFKENVRTNRVALSGGSTLLRFARCMTFDSKLERLILHPLGINPSADQVELDASSIVALLKITLKCEGYALHHNLTEGDFDRDTMSEQAYNVLFRGARDCRFAIVGVGNPWEHRAYRLPRILIPSDQEMRDNKVAADILFRLLDDEGREVDLPLNRSLPSLPLDDLRHIAETGHVVGIVQGIGKAKALRAVLNGKYISGIVTHDDLARELLAGG